MFAARRALFKKHRRGNVGRSASTRVTMDVSSFLPVYRLPYIRSRHVFQQNSEGDTTTHTFSFVRLFLYTMKSYSDTSHEFFCHFFCLFSRFRTSFARSCDKCRERMAFFKVASHFALLLKSNLLLYSNYRTQNCVHKGQMSVKGQFPLLSALFVIKRRNLTRKMALSLVS